MADDAMILIEKSLAILPTFLPAMKDIITVRILQHNKPMAQLALDKLKNVSIHLYYNNDEHIQYYQGEINKLD